MTSRDAYEACLIELNKVLAPSLLLNDFVYMFNKAIQQYFNLKYSLYEVNLQATDDLRVLTNSLKIEEYDAITNPNGFRSHNSVSASVEDDTISESYDCPLPADYVHILNVICEYREELPKSRCKDKCKLVRWGANKLNSNQWPVVLTNYYMRPSIRLPYYYIININGTGDPADLQYTNSLGNLVNNKVEDKEAGKRYGNSVVPIMLIKCGNDKVHYPLNAVYVDYLRAPKYVTLTQQELDAIEDNSQILEFPDYVIYEIINQIVFLVMENASDARLLSHRLASTTIAGASTSQTTS